MANEWGYNNGLFTAPDMNEKQLEINVSPKIHMLDPNFASLFSFLMAMGNSEQVDSQVFEWTEDEHLPFISQADENNGALTGDDSKEIVVTDVSGYRKNDKIINNRTNEVMLITDITEATKTLDVVRAYGSTAIASILEDDYLIHIHNANALGSDTVVAKATKPLFVENYCQIFKTSVSVDKSTAKHKLRVGVDERGRQRFLRGQEHVAGIERAFLFGQKKKDSTTFNKVAYNTGGVFEFIKTNVETDSNGTLTQDEFIDYVENVAFAHGSTEKLAIVGTTILQAISKWYDNRLQLDPTFQQLGVQVLTYVSPSGKKLYLKSHELFKRIPALKGTMLVLDMQDIAVMNYRATTLNLNIQAPSLDSYLDEYLTEVGLKVAQEKHHAILKGVTAYS